MIDKNERHRLRTQLRRSVGFSIGEGYDPFALATLKYDTALGGYRTGLTADRLRGAPKYSRRAIGTGTIAPATVKCTTTIRHHFGIERHVFATLCLGQKVATQERSLLCGLV